MQPILKSLKALKYLGVPKLWYYTCYQLGLQSGHYRRATPSLPDGYSGRPGLDPFTRFPEVPRGHKERTLSLADEILGERYRPFGGKPASLDLQAGSSHQHWSLLEKRPPDKDIKWIWEPGRFGWAITLARAYAFSGRRVYAEDFWQKTTRFLDAHPPNLGRQWQSAQEVAIRLMVLIFCERVFASAPGTTAGFQQRLWQAIAEHARRIPPTLVYARAQNNNHLLTEAAGLFAAGYYLKDHLQAGRWRQLGWRWLNWGFQHQISPFGTYIQHSTNYHRLMLQVALYADHIRSSVGAADWPSATRERLEEATRWLWSLTDPVTGQVPNLGANDGAYLFPLTYLNINDFRPVVDAAAKAFLKQDIYNQPELNEMSQWFGLDAPIQSEPNQPQAPDMLRLEDEHGRAFIHTAQFTDRPSHADQLHTDLWWHGVNIALDPGTYQYNAPPPWNNTLATTRVHNTLTIDGKDQMLPAGRFLWLDWAQAEILAHEIDAFGRIKRVTGEHDGYRNLGALHQRMITRTPKGWAVIDSVTPCPRPTSASHEIRLTWMMPDWDWSLEGDNSISLSGPDLKITLQILGMDNVHLVREGNCIAGDLTPEPSWGWASSTYGEKHPVLMLIARKSGRLPLQIESHWTVSD